MGVYIPNMEMPTSCGECKAFVCYRQWAGDMGDCFCGITKNDAREKEKNADCPLVPVPDHGRLIDADAEMKKLKRICLPDDLSYTIGHDIAKQFLKDAHTIIPAEEESNG